MYKVLLTFTGLCSAFFGFAQSFSIDIGVEDLMKNQRQSDAKSVEIRNVEFFVVDSIYCYNYDADNQIDVPTAREYNLEFEERGLALEKIRQEYDTTMNDWVNISYTTQAWDEHENLIESVEQVWVTDSLNWQNAKRSVYTPTGAGVFSEILNQVWNDSLENWQDLNRSLFTFDIDHNNTLLKYQEWDTLNVEWNNIFQIHNAFNGDNLLVANLFQLWSENTNDWKDANRTFFTNDTFSGHLIEQTAEIWDAGSDSWKKSNRQVFDYDGNGNNTLRISQLWSDFDSVWVFSEKVENVFDSGNNNVGSLTKQWNIGNGEWVNAFLTNRTFDSDNNETSFEISIWQNDFWLKLGHCEFFWRLIEIVNNNETFQDEFKCLLPNPFSKKDKVNCENLNLNHHYRLSVFDLLGNKIHDEDFYNNSNLDLNASLSIGLYVFVISDNQEILFKQKVIITE